MRDTVIQCKTDERPSLSDSEGENLSDEDDEEEMEEQAKGDTCSMSKFKIMCMTMCTVDSHYSQLEGTRQKVHYTYYQETRVHKIRS